MKPQHNSTTGLSLAVIFSLFVCLITNTAYAQSSLKTETVVANNGAITTSVAANYDSKVKADKKVVEEFASGVYQLRGWGIANTIAVDAKDGFIIIDTGDSLKAASEMRTALEKEIGAKVKVAAILYTHHHYVYGTSIWLDDGTKIIAHENLDSDMKADQGLSVYAGNVAVRGLTQFGFMNPMQGADAFPNSLGSTIEKLTQESGYLPATETIKDGVTVNRTIAGEAIEIAECKIDVQNSICFYFPDRSTLVTNFMASPSIFNLYSLRGDIYRDPLTYIAASDWALSKSAKYVLDIHSAGTRGKKASRLALEESRDQMQIIHDQTLRLISKGYDARRVAENIYIPVSILQDRETFGQVESHIKQVYNAKIGWMGNDIYDINPLSVNEETRRTLELMGGKAAVLKSAQAAVEKTDFENWKWAIYLSSKLLELDKQDQDARNIRAAASRKLGQHTTSANARGWYITEALAMENKLTIGPQAINRDAIRKNFGKASKEKILAAEIDSAVNYIRFLIDPKLAEGKRFGFELTIIDQDYQATVEVRNGVIAITPNDMDKSKKSLIKLTSEQWADFLISGDSEHSSLNKLNKLLDRG